MRARLYLDEDVVAELARLLRVWGCDAVSAREVGTLGLSDEEQLARAASEGRAILTHNVRHFSPLGTAWASAGRPHAGIVLAHRQYRLDEVGEALRLTLALLDVLDAENLENSVQVLESFRRSDA